MKNRHIVRPAVISIAALLLTAPALAGDWTGVYVGIGGGAAMANHELNLSNGPSLPVDFNVGIDGLGGQGGVFTLTAGADYQLDRNFVVGAFFDYDWMNADTGLSGAIGGLGAASTSFDVDHAWSIGGRIGFLPTERTLLFVTAGYTQADLSDMTFNVTNGVSTFTGVLASTGTLSGYFIGGGAEVKLTDSLSLKGEYRYSDYAAEDVTLLPALLPVVNNFVRTEIETSIQTARLSLNYRFGHDGGAAAPEDASATEAPAAGRSWSGLYLGLGGGVGIVDHVLDFSNGPSIPAPPFNISLDGLGGDGGVFTIGAGADYQLNDRIVVGLVANFDWTNIDTTIDAGVTGLGTARIETKVDDMWAIGGRIGYLPNPRTLLFVSAGYTQANLDDLTFSLSNGVSTFSGTLASVGTLSGYYVGGGAEIMLTDALSLKGEYRYSDYGSEDVTLLPTLLPIVNNFVSTEIETSVQTARVSLNYRFDMDRPAAEPLK